MDPVNSIDPIDPVPLTGDFEGLTGAIGGTLEDLGGPLAAAGLAYNLYSISQLPPSQQAPALNQSIWSLDGSLYGAEVGAEVGTFIGGPVGTLFGGLIGAFVGGYAGGEFGGWLNKHSGNGLK